MIVTFTFDYQANITEAEAIVLQPLLRGQPTIPMPKPEETHRWVFYGDYVGDLDRIIAAVPRLTQYIKLKSGDVGALAWDIILERLQSIESKMCRVGEPDRALNERVNVHVPGLGLLLINRVEIYTDCCTETLQEALENGWRILAVCPQPDQRRPDYVLGRSEGPVT